MGKKVLAERISGNERLRRQQERWERDRRREDRSDRAKKDEELNGVRIQLHEQAGTFASKDLLNALEHALESKIDAIERSLEVKIATTFENLNESGTEGFRETEAERHGREQATREILDNQATNRRWLIGMLVVIIMGIMANLVTLFVFFYHIATQG